MRGDRGRMSQQPEIRTKLTFIIQEEGKEAGKHERLQVVQSVYWVLQAWWGAKQEKGTTRG